MKQMQDPRMQDAGSTLWERRLAATPPRANGPTGKRVHDLMQPVELLKDIPSAGRG
jgi:hypothetical protein